jgi:thiol-disulfide isomerase/thioredoxin
MNAVKHIAFLAALLCAACTGHTEEETILRADRTEIFADGADAVRFTVDFLGGDVTTEAVVNASAGTVADGVFTTETKGTYTFTAVYNGIASRPVTVRANEASLVLSAEMYDISGDTRSFRIGAVYGSRDVSTSEELTVAGGERAPDGYYTVTTEGDETKTIGAQWNGHLAQEITVGRRNFYKRVGILEFTGTWCQACPDMAAYIEGAAAAYPGRSVTLAVHYNDPLAIPYAAGLATMFKISTYPTAVLDFGAKVNNTTTSASDLERRLREIVEASPAKCGLAIDVAVSGDNAVATVRLLAGETMSYGVAVALVEDGVTGYPQTLQDKSKDNGYVHGHVLREIHGNNIEGVSLGEVAEGAVVSREFTFDMKNYKPENCKVVVFATSELVLLNAAECAVGGSTGFKYE